MPPKCHLLHGSATLTWLFSDHAQESLSTILFQLVAPLQFQKLTTVGMESVEKKKDLLTGALFLSSQDSQTEKPIQGDHYTQDRQGPNPLPDRKAVDTNR